MRIFEDKPLMIKTSGCIKGVGDGGGYDTEGGNLVRCEINLGTFGCNGWNVKAFTLNSKNGFIATPEWANYLIKETLEGKGRG